MASKRKTLIERVNATGSHWFDRDTMEFFHTTLDESDIWEVDADTVVFVTSETSPSDERAWSIRVARFYRKDGTERVGIDTVGEFGQYAERVTARQAASAFLANMRETRTHQNAPNFS